MTSVCKLCATPFDHTRPQKYCCTTCRLADTHGTCILCGELMRGRSADNLPSRAHLECVAKSGVERVCEFEKCGKPFSARTLSAKFCRRSHAVQQSQVRRGKPCRVCGKAVQWQRAGSDNPIHKDCADPLPKTSRTVNIRRMPDSLRDLILDRDKLVCQICHLPCSREGGKLSGNYPTVDHIIPLISFLHLEREEAILVANDLGNLRCAHRSCNLKKNRKIEQAIVLVNLPANRGV